MRPALLTVILAIAAWPARARADRADYVGSAACGACHAAELAAWQASAHARAAASPSMNAVARRCYACHGTGDAPAGVAYWPEVGCESCHGAGAAYAPDDVMRDPALAGRLGLRDVTTPAARAAVCAACHRAGAAGSTRLAPLDSAALAKPVHPIGKPTP